MIKITDISFGTLLNETFTEYSKDFMKYFKNLLLIYVIPSTILAFFFNLIFEVFRVGSYFTELPNSGLSSITNTEIAVLVVFILLIYFFLLLILGSLYSCSLVKIKKLKDNNVNLNTKNVFRNAKRLIFPNIGMGILQFLAYMGIFVLTSIPPTLIYFATRNNIAAILSGVVFVIIAFVFFFKLMINWSFSIVALLYDNKKVIDSMRFSKNLVKKDWWKVAGKVILIGLIVGGLAGALSLPLIFVNMFLNLIPIIGNAIRSGISAAMGAAVAPLGIIFLTNLYKGMKENHNMN